MGSIGIPDASVEVCVLLKKTAEQVSKLGVKPLLFLGGYCQASVCALQIASCAFEIFFSTALSET